jgi:hypothetical protein
LRLTTTHATNQPDTKDEGHIGLFCLSEIFLYIYKERERERERERYGSGATKRDIRARFDLFFFSDFIAPGQWNFLVKGRKTNRKEREREREKKILSPR